MLCRIPSPHNIFLLISTMTPRDQLRIFYGLESLLVEEVSFHSQIFSKIDLSSALSKNGQVNQQANADRPVSSLLVFAIELQGLA